MTNKARALLSLVVELSAIENAENLKSRFLEGLNEIFPDKRFFWQSEGDGKNALAVVVGDTIFGHIVYTENFGKKEIEEFTALQDAVRLVGVIIHSIAYKNTASPRRESSSELTEQIGKQSARMNVILKTMPDLLFVIDLNGYYTEYFASDTNQLALPPDKILGANLQDVFGNEKGEEVLKLLVEAVQTGNMQVFEYPLIIHGDQLWFEARVSPLDQFHVLTIVRDITERKRMVDQLSMSFRWLDSLISHLYAGVLAVSAEGIVKHVNQAFCDLFGLNESPGELRGLTAEAMIAKVIGSYASPEATLQRIQKIVSEGKPIKGEEVEMRDGRYFMVDYVPIISENAERGRIWHHQDITSRKRAEQMLQLSEERFRKAFLISPDSININRLSDGKYISVNEGFCRVTGYKEEEIIGRTSIELNIWDDIEDRKRLVAGLQREGRVENLEARFRTKDGTVKSGLMSATVIELNNETHILSITRDISALKQADTIKQVQYNIASAVIYVRNINELYESIRRELHSLMDTKNFFVAIYDEKTGMLTAPFEKDEHDSIPEWAAEKSLTGKVIKEKKSLLIRRAEIEELARSGSIDLIGTTAESWLGVPLRAGDRVTGAIVIQSFDNPNAYDSASIEILEIVAHEISIYLEREKAEASALKLSKAVIQSPVSIIITDWSGKIEYVNPKFTEVSGYAYEEVIGQNPRILQSGRQSKEVYEGLWMTILSGKDWQGELMNKKKNGELFWENVVISAIVNDEGDITHFVAVKEDITEKKRMIDQVIAAKENAEEMNKVKSSFFANMSHELRTPLIGILGFAEILEEELKRTPDTQRMVETIKISGQRLLGTLNFILDISKLEAKKTQVNLQSTNIIAVLSESANLFTSAATKRKLSYVISFPSDVIYCIIDPVLLRVVIDNLLNNAIRFTDRGKICVSAVIKDGHAIIEISDTGIGIPPEKQQIIWEEFRQASEGHSRNYEGTGLGLTIAKKYTELMHGTIALKSAVNVGTTFTLSFPLVQSQGAQSTVEAVVGMAGGEPPIQTRPRPCILYVEDDGIAIDLVSRYTHGLYVIETAGQGDTALRLAQEKQYDAILMDINLRSGMDGTQVTEKIRELPEYKETPIIAITAYAMEKEIQDFLQRGMSHYISKPFSKKDLLLLLGSVFQGSRFNP